MTRETLVSLNHNYNYGTTTLFPNPTLCSFPTKIKIMVPQNYFRSLHYGLSRPELKLWCCKLFPNPMLCSFQTKIKIMVPQNSFPKPTQWSFQTRIKIMVLQNYFQILCYAFSRPKLKLWYCKTISEAYTMVFPDQNYNYGPTKLFLRVLHNAFNYNYGTMKLFPSPTLWSLQTRINIMVPQNNF
jgi:hypothetical protein